MVKKKLELLSKQNVDLCDVSLFKRIDEISIDSSMDIEKRLSLYMDEIENPYCFLCGETPIKICFSEGTIDLRKRLFNYFSGLK